MRAIFYIAPTSLDAISLPPLFLKKLGISSLKMVRWQ